MKNILAILLFSVFAISSNAQYKIGSVVEDLLATNYNGEDISLSNFEDKAGVIVVFTSYKCKEANSAMEKLAKLQQQYAPQGYVILAVDVTSGDGNDQDIAELVSQKKLNFLYAIDGERELLRQFLGNLADYLPYVFLLKGTDVDDTKTFKVAYMGAVDAPTSNYLDLAVKEMLKQQSTSKASSSSGSTKQDKSDKKSSGKAPADAKNNKASSSFVEVTKVDSKTCSVKKL